jgi:hypothetical protein
MRRALPLTQRALTAIFFIPVNNLRHLNEFFGFPHHYPTHTHRHTDDSNRCHRTDQLTHRAHAQEDILSRDYLQLGRLQELSLVITRKIVLHHFWGRGKGQKKTVAMIHRSKEGFISSLS